MRKLFWTALFLGGAAWFVGTDALTSRVHTWRAEARAAVAADVPLRNQLAEARRQVDTYAESIIRGEVAAEALADRIRDVEREIRTLAVRVGNERESLAALRTTLDDRGGAVLATSLPLQRDTRDERSGVIRRARAFQAASSLLERRAQDLERLKGEHASTLSALDKAREEQMQLGQEVSVLAAELDSLEARKAAARTRQGVSSDGDDGSGWAEARERIDRIRASLREQGKLLAYYEVERDLGDAVDLASTLPAMSGDPVQALDEVLAAYPVR
jgi:phage shock protein A